MAFKSLTGFDASDQNIVNVADPSANTHAANKQYVDGVARGLRWKESVRAASTTNGALASAFADGNSLDGITLATGDRILLKNQSTASENGIYVVAASGAPSRAADLATSSSAKGVAVTVINGTVNNDRVYIQTEDPAVVGTNDLLFSQLGGAGTSYTAGAGLNESPAGTFNVTNTDGSITVAADTVSVASQVAGAGLTLTSGVLDVVGDASITVGANSLGLATGVSGTGLTLTSGVLNVVGGTGITANANDIAIDSSIVVTTPATVVRKYAVNVPSGSTSAVINHALATRDITWQLYEIGTSTWADMVCDAVRTDTNNLTLTFAVAPTSGQYRVVVHG